MENTAKKGFWGTFKEKHPAVAQFIVFFIISNGVTVLQMIMMPAIKICVWFYIPCQYEFSDSANRT